MSAQVKRYALRIMGDDTREDLDLETLEVISAALSEAEERISASLPEGYYAKVDEIPSAVRP